MAFPETDPNSSYSPSSYSPSAPAADAPASQTPPVRPSWETPRSAAPPRRPVPAQTAPPEPAPYYRSAAPPAPAYQPAAPPAYTPPPAAAYQAPVYQAAPIDTEVKYDLAGNPIPSTGSAAPAAAGALAPPAPFGYSAGNAGTWPPPAGGFGHGAQAYRNNSGEQSHLPPEIERLRWNWGAFFFPIWWTRYHGLTTIAAMLGGGLVCLRLVRYIAAAIDPMLFLGICALYGVAYFALQVYGGINGHRIGWRNRHFPGGLEEYFKVQAAWMWWGFGLNFLLGPVLFVVLFAIGFSAALLGHSSRTHHHYSSYSQPYSNGGYHSSYNNQSNGDGSSVGSDPAATN